MVQKWGGVRPSFVVADGKTATTNGEIEFESMKWKGVLEEQKPEMERNWENFK